MDNYYGKQALKKMYEMIWACSTVSVIDSELDENSDKLYVEALEYIDAQLIPAVESEGDWEEKWVVLYLYPMFFSSYTCLPAFHD